LSQSLPLAKKRFNKRECRPFFAGILPEEAKREIIARNLGISARNDFALASMYDLVSTAAYPEPTTKMAMKIGGEYEPERVGPRQIEKLAIEAALSVPMVRNRVPELATAVIAALPAVTAQEPFVEVLVGQIRSRCQQIIQRFRR